MHCSPRGPSEVPCPFGLRRPRGTGTKTCPWHTQNWRRRWQPTPGFLPAEWTEEPGGLHSTRSQRVGHNRATDHTRLHRTMSKQGLKACSFFLFLETVFKSESATKLRRKERDSHTSPTSMHALSPPLSASVSRMVLFFLNQG